MAGTARRAYAPPAPAAAGESVRLIHLVGALSLVIDLGLGQPLEHALLLAPQAICAALLTNVRSRTREAK